MAIITRYAGAKINYHPHIVPLGEIPTLKQQQEEACKKINF